MTALPPGFLDRPFAHRALHDAAAGRPENSLGAVEAAVEAGFGIEVDVQLTADGAAIVFHDDTLERLTGETGRVRDRTLAEMQALGLKGEGGAPPSLVDCLAAIKGRVPLLVEIKDQSGDLGPDIGALEASVARELSAYGGPVAVMSFNPHSVAEMARLAPSLPRGLTTAAFDPESWPGVPPHRLERLRGIPDYEATGSVFISHEAADLERSRVAELKQLGARILCWTIRSPEAEADARRIADTVTFEGYLPAP